MKLSGHTGTVKLYAGVCVLRLHAPWVHSLKEKRMLVKSLLSRVKNKFNLSAAEVSDMDLHQTVVLGLSCVSGDFSVAESMLQAAAAWIESNTDAEVTETITEIF